MKKPRCISCAFLGEGCLKEPALQNVREDEPETKVVFECRRYAPRLVHGVGTGYDGDRYPIIENPEIHWCGEHSHFSEYLMWKYSQEGCYENE
jgi:hypothetical protein